MVASLGNELISTQELEASRAPLDGARQLYLVSIRQPSTGGLQAAVTKAVQRKACSHVKHIQFHKPYSMREETHNKLSRRSDSQLMRTIVIPENRRSWMES